MPRYLSTARLLAVLGLLMLSSTQSRAQEEFTLSVLTTGLEYPWEIIWGLSGFPNKTRGSSGVCRG